MINVRFGHMSLLQFIGHSKKRIIILVHKLKHNRFNAEQKMYFCKSRFFDIRSAQEALSCICKVLQRLIGMLRTYEYVAWKVKLDCHSRASTLKRMPPEKCIKNPSSSSATYHRKVNSFFIRTYYLVAFTFFFPWHIHFVWQTNH